MAKTDSGTDDAAGKQSVPGVDTGEYLYRCNGEPVSVRESFRRCRTGGGTQIESVREAPGITLLVEASGAGSAVEQCRVVCRRDGVPELAAEMSWCRGQLQYRRSRAGVPLEESVCSSGVPPLLSPLMRIFYGPVILGLVGMGGAGEVVMPWIGDPEDDERFLQMQRSERRARQQAQEGSTTVYEYTGDQYGPGSLFWIDESGDLTAYRWQPGGAQLWEVTLQRG